MISQETGNFHLRRAERRRRLTRAGSVLAGLAMLLPNASCSGEVIPQDSSTPDIRQGSSECVPTWSAELGFGNDGQTTRYTGPAGRVGGVVVEVLSNHANPVQSGDATKLYIAPTGNCTFPEHVEYVGTDIPPDQAADVTVGECWGFNIPDWMTFSNPNYSADERLTWSYVESGYQLDSNPEDAKLIKLRPEGCP